MEQPENAKPTGMAGHHALAGNAAKEAGAEGERCPWEQDGGGTARRAGPMALLVHGRALY